MCRVRVNPRVRGYPQTLRERKKEIILWKSREWKRREGRRGSGERKEGGRGRMDKGVGSICLGSERGGRRMGKEAGIERLPSLVALYLHVVPIRAVLTNGHTGHVPRAPGFFSFWGPPTGCGEIIFLKTNYIITFAKINCKGNPVYTFLRGARSAGGAQGPNASNALVPIPSFSRVL